MSRGATLDRRVLRAFYTQYVAVLLILLVFCVGAVSGNDRRMTPPSRSQAPSTNAEPVGTVHYEGIFTSGDSAEVHEGPEFEALIEVIKNHDLRAVVKLDAELGSQRAGNNGGIIARARTLRARLISRGIPDDAVEVVLVPAPASTNGLSVTFSSLEGPDEQL